MVFVLSFMLPNFVSNVPAVMLLLPAATHLLEGTIMAVASTFVDQAQSWLDHARVVVPIS